MIIGTRHVYGKNIKEVNRMKGPVKIRETKRLSGSGELPEANKVRVFIVNHEYKADYNVFFVSKPHEETNTRIISPGELVDQAYKADVKVFIVDQEYRAKIKIMQRNFPR